MIDRTETDELGIYTPTIATYSDLELMAKGGTFPGNGNGSKLAASLLQLPNVFTTATASVLIDSSEFVSDEFEYELGVSGELDDRQTVAAERFAGLAEAEAEEKGFGELDLGLLAVVVDLAQEDTEAAQEFYRSQAIESIRPLGRLEKVRLLLDELNANSPEVTPEQLLLVADYGTAETASRVFPEAEKLFQALQEETLTPAQQRRVENRLRNVRERNYAAGGRALAEGTDLDIMILLDEDPEATASVALNSSNVKQGTLLDILEKAADMQIAHWLMGLERQVPRKGDIEALTGRFDTARVNEIARVCREQIETTEMDLSVPWILDIMRHVYIPSASLDAPTAAVVWHGLSQTCGNDPSLWLAVALADNSDTPLRLSDVLI